MNRTIKKIMTFALAGAMTLGMGTTALAAEGFASSNLTTGRDNVADTPTINLLKDYVNGSDQQTNTKSPQEDFQFTIENYGLWNVGQDGNGVVKYTKDTMPAFQKSYMVSAPEGTAGTGNKPSAALTVPTYEAVGDYWYKVTETDQNVAGVIYGTNDSHTEDIAQSNGGHDGVYYLHVQVTNAETNGQYIRTVTLHKTAPTANLTNAQYESWTADNYNIAVDQKAKKVDSIQNKYYAGSLSITKKVTGNAGDKDQLFKVSVVFKNESGASMNSNITYKNFYDEHGNLTTSDTAIFWKDTLNGTTHTKETSDAIDFYVKDGTTVTFDNIPYGVTYTVTETQPTDDKYTHSFAYDTATQNVQGTFNGVTTSADTVTSESTAGDAAAKWNAATVTGSISDASDTVTLTNNKASVIDIGVFTSNAPYIAVLILAGVAVLVSVKRRKDMIGE